MGHIYICDVFLKSDVVLHILYAPIGSNCYLRPFSTMLPLTRLLKSEKKNFLSEYWYRILFFQKVVETLRIHPYIFLHFNKSFSAKCTVIVRLLNFLTALWTKYPKDTIKAIDNSFYNNDLTKLILTCVLNPTQLGFDINNDEINKKLPERVCLTKNKNSFLSIKLI